MRRILQNLLLVVVGSFIAGLTVEGVLRLIGYSSPSFYTYDADLGHALRAGAEGLYQKEGKAYIKINKGRAFLSAVNNKCFANLFVIEEIIVGMAAENNINTFNICS